MALGTQPEQEETTCRARHSPQPRERLGLSIARNTGLREATGEIAIFVDDDITFLEGWAAAMEAPFADQEVTAVGGPIHPVFPEGVPTWYREGVMADGGTTTGYYEHGEVLREFRPRGEIGHPRGGNMAIRRVRALKIGGFREDLGWGKRKIPGEETEFFGRLSRDGGTIHYVPGARVHHHLDLERTSLKHLRRWHQGYGRASILMNPPKDPVRWVLKFVEQVVNLICYSIRLVLPGGLAVLPRPPQATPGRRSPRADVGALSGERSRHHSDL